MSVQADIGRLPHDNVSLSILRLHAQTTSSLTNIVPTGLDVQGKKGYRQHWRALHGVPSFPNLITHSRLIQPPPQEKEDEGSTGCSRRRRLPSHRSLRVIAS